MSIRICYWDQTPGGSSWPTPGTWDPTTKAKVIRHLQASYYYQGWMGYSWCRLCELTANGTTCRTDGKYVFPEGTVHYVEKHDVLLPADFVTHVLQYPPALLELMEAHIGELNHTYRTYKSRFHNIKGCRNRQSGICQPEDNGEGCILDRTHRRDCNLAHDEYREASMAVQLAEYAAISAAAAPHGLVFKRPWYLD